MAEWLGRGLQNLVQRFESASDLTGPDGEMVDALVSGASVERRVGSSPILGTIYKDNNLICRELSFIVSENCPLFAHIIKNSIKKSLSIPEKGSSLLECDMIITPQR